MRFRMGLLVGFGTGYYLGTKAGRERYEQINEALEKLKHSETFEVATEKARTAADLAAERAKQVVESRSHGGAHNIGNGDDGADNPYLRPTPGA